MMENNEMKENIVTTTVEDVLHTSMIPYAESVILDRALPRVEDGLKPVQRRILYAMYDLGLTPDKPYKKSAKVVGECLAKYHPHGDSSVYDAMVKLAQPFSMGNILVDGQGNFGTIDGDGAAAMRYTEARLNNLALEMLRDLEKDTVEWQNNYDDSLKEPVTLPSRIPNILVNGAMGIAVGLATNIPTHNLGECLDACIALIKNPKIKLSEIMQIMPGPDFPTGGKIVNKEDIVPAYETGNGKILVRATSNIEVDNQGKQSIIITEIPYRVNKGSLLEKIGELIDSKNGAYAQVSEAVDESDRQGMRIVIKIRRGGDASLVWKSLLKDTQLQNTFGVNMVVIAEGKPQQLGIIEILRHYTNYQKQVVLNRTKYDLNKAKLRLEIVEGLIIAVTNIDKVISIIKKSPDTPTAKQNLRKEFDLSDVQAQAILDLKLARITRLEVQNLKDELSQLKETIKYLQSIIDSKTKLNQVIIDEMTLIKKQFKTPRRTKIEKDDRINLSSYNEGELAGAQEEVENIVVGYTGDGKVKKVPLMSYSRSKKVNPLPEELFVCKCDARSNQYILAFTDMGNAFKIRPKNIDGSKGMNSKGVQVNALCSDVMPTEKIIFMYPMTAGEEDKAEGKLITYSENGMVKLSELKELFISKDYYQVFKLKEGDKAVSAEIFDENKDMFFASERGMCLLADKSEVPVQGRVAGGVKGMDVDDDDKVIFAGQVSQLEEYVSVTTSFGTFKKVELKTINRIARARKGVLLVDLGKKENNEIVISVANFKKDDKSLVAILDRLGIMYYIELDDIVYDSRTTKGKMVSKIGECQPNVVYYARRQ